jgi:hypothetical protein
VIPVKSEATPRPDTRYWAEWVSAERPNEFGEFDPDGVEYSRIQCRSLDDAKRESIKRGKAANVAEWARVTQEDFNASVSIPRRHPAAWDTTCQWHGTWDGHWEEDRWS